MNFTRYCTVYYFQKTEIILSLFLSLPPGPGGQHGLPAVDRAQRPSNRRKLAAGEVSGDTTGTNVILSSSRTSSKY
jgi:hypothetical protein